MSSVEFWGAPDGSALMTVGSLPPPLANAGPPASGSVLRGSAHESPSTVSAASAQALPRLILDTSAIRPLLQCDGYGNSGALLFHLTDRLLLFCDACPLGRGVEERGQPESRTRIVLR